MSRQNWGATCCAPYKKIREIRAVESIFFGHEETIADQAESEADKDFRRMSKSSGRTKLALIL
jgi:hypothetical protein